MPIDSNFRNEQLAGETNLGASAQEIDALLAPILDQGATRDQIPEQDPLVINLHMYVKILQQHTQTYYGIPKPTVSI